MPIDSSWALRVDHEELVEFQLEGTWGSVRADLRNRRIQHRAATPEPACSWH
ncbi:hypothetical protein [Streptomyces sp. NPDC001037]|uniref:hypothetical protein n=1 Tax=Streptomyces sp. NPDC001037 TaxID=3364542 RepID=UPI0036A513F9